MSVFLLLLGKLIPLYVLILFGYIAGRVLHARRETVASLLIYFVVPMVIFYGVASTPLQPSLLMLPVITFVFAAGICMLFYWIASPLWNDSTRNILAYAAGTGNTGYFGLPLILTLFSEKAFGIAIIAGLGFVLYESSVGLLFVAKSSRSMLQSMKKVLTIPLLYSFFAGLAFNVSGLQLPQAIVDLLVSFRGAYTVLGMMLIGLGIAGSGSSKIVIDVPFIGMAFLAKFVVWPLLMILVMWADARYFHLFEPLVRNVMLTLSIVPMAANTVAYATELKTHPEKAASAVLLSTLFALFYIPMMVGLLLL
jgi:hypothetical protein